MQTSEQINEIATALAKAQGAMEGAKKDSDNPFFKSKYADLAAVVEAIRKPLSANGLSYVQGTDTDDAGGVVVVTRLMHSSGQWIESSLRMTPSKNDPQGVGSAITYARRYALQSMAGVPAEDDDGNAESVPAQRGAAVARETQGRAPATKPVTESQTAAMQYAERALIEAGVAVVTDPGSPQRPIYLKWLREMYEQALGHEITKILMLSATDIRIGANKIVTMIQDRTVEPFRPEESHAGSDPLL